MKNKDGAVEFHRAPWKQRQHLLRSLFLKKQLKSSTKESFRLQKKNLVKPRVFFIAIGYKIIGERHVPFTRHLLCNEEEK